MGSINGLVCLLDCLKPTQIVLWNPAIRQSKIIYVQFQLEVDTDICGFGWDSVANDYKVVMSSKGKFSVIYSCNSACWRVVESFLFPVTGTSLCTPAAIVKGVPYWTFTIYYQEKCIFRLNIVKFEAGCNEFKLLPVFENHATPGGHGFLLVCLKDSLTVMLYNQGNSNSLVDLYWLDEGCGVWRRMYKVGPIPCYISKLWHCFNYDGEVVFCKFGDIFCYDSKTNEVKGFGIQKACLRQCFSYKASLVCVDGMESLRMGKPPAYRQGLAKHE